MKTKIFLCAISFFILIIAFNNCYAQKDFISDTSKKFTNGQIIISDNATMTGKLDISQKAYDDNIIGVYFIYEREKIPEGTIKKVPISNITLNEGVVYVKYNSENGSIKKGDYITSSSEGGVGMKASKSGIIVGVALEDAVSQSGLIKIRIMIQYVIL